MREELRAFGYLCPRCRRPVLTVRDPFSLTASALRMPCDCGASALETEYDGGSFRVTVPCGLCGGIHTAVCPAGRLLHGATALSCPATGEFDCFIGPEGIVERHLADLSFLAEKGKAEDSSSAFLDNVIMYEVLSELKEIAARPHGITCRCGSGQYRMTIRRSAVDLTCGSCGGRLRIPAATDADLDSLCCHLTLTIPGRGKH